MDTITKEQFDKLFTAFLDMRADYNDVQERLRQAEQTILALTNSLYNVQAILDGPFRFFLDHYSDFQSMIVRENTQSQDEIGTVAERFLRKKMSEAFDTVAEDMKNEILQKIQKQSALW